MEPSGRKNYADARPFGWRARDPIDAQPDPRPRLPPEPLVIKNSTATQSRSALGRVSEATLAGQRATAGLALRTIFLNLFRHNSERLNSARYESRWRFTVTLCWRDGEPTPCPAAATHVKGDRAGHQVEIEFSVAVTDLALVMRMRVDDAVLVESFPSVRLARGYPKELRALMERHFGLAYPKVEDQLVG